MIAQLVTCPTCDGSGEQTIEYPAYPLQMSGRFKKRTQRCLSCRDHRGQVEADRVCPTCHKFIEMCVCVIGHRNTEVRKLEMPDTGEIRIRVAWVSEQKAWRVYAKQGKKTYHIMQCPDRGLAEQAASEAEGLSPDEYPTLREKYKMLRKSQGPVPASPPVITLDPAKQNVQDVLLDCIAKALQADESLRRLRLAAQAACDDANAAEQVAIDAWNVVIATLRDRAGADSALNRSALAQS